MRPTNDLKRYAKLHAAKLIDSLETPDDDGLNEDEKEFIHQEYKKITKRVFPDHEKYGPEFLEEIDREANEPKKSGRERRPTCPFCGGTKTKPFMGDAGKAQDCDECDKHGRIPLKRVKELGLEDWV